MLSSQGLLRNVQVYIACLLFRAHLPCKLICSSAEFCTSFHVQLFHQDQLIHTRASYFFPVKNHAETVRQAGHARFSVHLQKEAQAGISINNRSYLHTFPSAIKSIGREGFYNKPI